MKLDEEDTVIKSGMLGRQVESAQNGLKEITTIPVNRSYNTMM